MPLLLVGSKSMTNVLRKTIFPFLHSRSRALKITLLCISDLLLLLCVAGLQIDRAVNVDALTPARLFNRELLLARRPAAGGPRGMGWMHRVREHHRFVVRQGIQ